MSISDRQRAAALARTQRALRWIIWPSYAFIVGGAAVFLATGISLRPLYTLVWHGCGLIAVAVAHRYTEKGEVETASRLLIFLFLLIYSSSVLLSGGTRSPYMGGYLLVIVGAGILRGTRGTLLTTATSLALATLFLFQESAGLLPTPWMPMTSSFNLVAWSLIYGMTGILLYVTLGELQTALTHAERTEVALEGALDDLHQTSVSKSSVEAVLRELGDAVFMLDADARIREVNPEAERMLGEPAAALVGRAFDDLVDDDRDTSCLRTVGGPVHVSLSRSTMLDARGDVDGIVIVAHDIQARVDTEQALRQASRAKSTFLATMSHELRTPLNAIIGYAEFVQEELEDDALVRDVSRIERSGRDLLTLINDILDLSKIEAGRIEFERRAIDVQALLAEVVAQVEPLVTANGNRFLVELPEAPITATSDPTRLRQILRNLLSNAGKFTEDGEIGLVVGVQDDQLQIVVRDTGIGMTPEQLERVWQPFTQADSTTTRRFGGTGLGLPITRRLCELLGGSIDARSTPGEGTRFVVHLPLTAPPPEESTHA